MPEVRLSEVLSRQPADPQIGCDKQLQPGLPTGPDVQRVQALQRQLGRLFRIAHVRLARRYLGCDHGVVTAVSRPERHVLFWRRRRQLGRVPGETHQRPVDRAVDHRRRSLVNYSLASRSLPYELEVWPAASATAWFWATAVNP